MRRKLTVAVIGQNECSAETAQLAALVGKTLAEKKAVLICGGMGGVMEAAARGAWDRNEALIRNYRRLGFVDVFANDQLMPLAHTGGLPHRILAFDNQAALRHWRETGHPLYCGEWGAIQNTPLPLRLAWYRRLSQAPRCLSGANRIF